MLPILHIGPLSLQTPGLILLLGLWLSLELTERHAPFYQLTATQVYNLALISIASGLVGARLAYAAQYAPVFLKNPLDLISLNPSLLNLEGGLLAAALAGVIYFQRNQISFMSALDALTTLFSILAVAIGLAHLASGDAFGAAARLPWSISLWGTARHPSQVYETLAAWGIAAAVWPRQRGHLASLLSRSPGLRWWIFAALSAAARLFLEAFRGDSSLLFHHFRQAQIAAWLILAVCLWQIGRHLFIPIERTHDRPNID